MKNIRILLCLAMAAMLAAACNDSATESIAETATAPTTVKPQGPVRIDYNIIGMPIVGRPVAIDLLISSVADSGTVTVNYRISDSTAMQFPEAELRTVDVAPSDSDVPVRQQVRVIPLREGRLYLEVSAELQTDGGTVSSAIAVPVQVGPAPDSPPAEHGTLTTDESGRQLRVLDGD